jgi:glycerophosphoryl diester phosphodiesterase
MLMRMTLDHLYQNRTLIFGHRGASAYAPMNTLPAFALAEEQGADGIELDIHLSRDGHLIVMHNSTIEETTDGSGAIRDMTLAQLKEMDAGGWFSERFTRTPIPTLDEVFASVRKETIINVEIKPETIRTEGIERVLADKIAHFGLQERIIVSSFNPLPLRRFRRLMPNVAIARLWDSKTPWYHEFLMFGMHYEAQHPRHTLLEEQAVARLHRKGYRVNTWTVNDAMRAAVLRDLGVDGIMTDLPDVIRHALNG